MNLGLWIKLWISSPFPVDKAVDKMWITLPNRVIHILSTGFPQVYPQDKEDLSN